jgi:hypothetical protein
VVEYIEGLRPELQPETLCQVKVLRQASVQVPKIRPHNFVTSAAILSGRGNTEKRLCAGNVLTIEMRVSQGSGDEATGLV